MPLVGIALMAMQAHPNGFTRSRHRADTFSNRVKRALRFASLLSDPGRTVYSLRHTFEDRLAAMEVSDKLGAALMVHKYHRPRCGKVPSLVQKKECFAKIVFALPSSV